MLEVAVVILESGYASTAIGPIEVFHSAGRIWNWLHGEAPQPRFRVRTASVDGRAVTSLCGLGLQAEFALRDIEHADIVIVPASGWDAIERIARDSPLVPWLRDQHARGAYVAGVCSGVAFLAEAGILDGRRATTHWGVAAQLRERYPRVDWQADRFLTEDGRLCCGGGVYASIDLSLYLVEKFCGRDVALQVAKSLLLSMPRSRQSGYSVLPLSRPHEDARISRAEEHLQRHFRDGVTVEALAALVGMSVRTFLRRFKAATGRQPGAYLQTLRMAAAKELLERDTLPVQNVSARVGYENVAFFRSLFKRHTGMTPAEYRQRFAPMSVGARGELSDMHGAPGAARAA